MPSIFDVAKQAGVSASTVSRTFNSPHLINDRTKRIVLEAAEVVNYRPRRPREPAPAADRRVATLRFHFFSERPGDTLHRNAFYSEVLAGALSEASDLNLRLILSTSARFEEPRAGHPLRGSAEGALLVGAPDAAAAALFPEAPNLVFVDTRDPSGKHDSVVSDNFGGGSEAVRYLIGLGHRRIGFVSGRHEIASFSERLNGYVSAQFHAGLQPDRRLIATTHVETIEALLQSPDRPTAILGANDECAVVVMQVCQRLGIAIPGDLSLIGFDDLEFTTQVLPALTSVHVPRETLGRLGVRRLWARMQDAANSTLADLPSCSLVPVSLVERDSCAALTTPARQP